MHYHRRTRPSRIDFKVSPEQSDLDRKDRGARRLLVSSAIIAQGLAFLAQMLRMNLALVGHVQPVRLLQRPLKARGMLRLRNRRET